MMTTERFCNIFIGLWIALAVAFFIAVSFACFGCASAPVAEGIVKVSGAATIPEGCTQSTLAKSGDQYSYQGDIDPQTIYNEWVEVPKLREGDYRMGAMCYRNPDFNSDITAAELVMQAGVCAAFCYLELEELGVSPRAFVYDPASACYVEMEMDGGQKKKFIDRLLVILYANSTAI